MTKIYNTKSIFTESHEISIGDSILEEGVTLDIQSIEYADTKLRLELSDSELLDLHRLITCVLDDRKKTIIDTIQNSIEKEIVEETYDPELAKNYNFYIIGHDPYESEANKK